MKRFTQVCRIACLGILLAATAAFAQPSQPLFNVVHCMQSTSPEYVVFELDSWLPYHQQRVDNGEMVSWTLYGVLFGDRSECDHMIIETFRNEAQVHQAYQGMAPGNDSDMNPMDEPEMIANTFSARRMMSSSLWQTVNSTGIDKHNYAVVNLMHSKDQPGYETVEDTLYRPMHQWLKQQGLTGGWALYRQLYPFGSNVAHDYISVDYLTNLEPLPWAQAMQVSHPDLTYEELSKQADEARTLLQSKVLVRIGGTR